jgi:2-phospho-L-lactate/phosphoenolpyruvate guanylyltransferase
VPLKPPPRTVAVLPVKSFDSAKQRLADVLGTGSRKALARAMFSDVLASLRHVEGIETVAVVTGDRVAESAAYGEGVHVIRDTEEAGQSQAAGLGIQWALTAGFERALLVPGDTPLLDAQELQDLLDLAEEARLGAIIVPDRHGTGTNALLLSPPGSVAPSFGPGSMERHAAAAREAGLEYRVQQVPSLALDVDTGDDLAMLSGRLDDRRGHAQMTRGALRQLDRLHVPAPAVPVGAAARV